MLLRDDMSNKLSKEIYKNHQVWATLSNCHDSNLTMSICELFSTFYQVLFGEEAPCLSLEGQKLVKEHGDWYMTLVGVYIRIASITKPPHWLPDFVPNTLLL